MRRAADRIIDRWALFDGMSLGGNTHMWPKIGDVCGVVCGTWHADGAGSDDVENGVFLRDALGDHTRMFRGADELEDSRISADIDELAVEFARRLAQVDGMVGVDGYFDQHDFARDDAVVEDLLSGGDDIDELIELRGDVIDAGLRADGDEVTACKIGIFGGRDGDAIDIPSTSAEDEGDAVEDAGAVVEVECERKGF